MQGNTVHVAPCVQPQRDKAWLPGFQQRHNTMAGSHAIIQWKFSVQVLEQQSGAA